MSIGGGICLGGGILAFLVENNNHDFCKSGLGELGQALSHNVANQCTADNGIWTLGVVAMVIGATLLVGGVVVTTRSQNMRASQGPPLDPPPQPPGWYADPFEPSQFRWWDGLRWTTRRRPRDG